MKRVVCSCVDSDLVRAVAARIGAEASTYTTVSESRYRELSCGGRLARMWLRWLMTGGYVIRLAVRIFRSERDSLWVVTTNPFFAPGVAVVVARLRGQKVVHHVFDLYPDALVAAGILKELCFSVALLAAWTRMTQRSCAGAVYLGEGLRRYVELKYGRARLSAVISVTVDERDFLPELTQSSTCLILHYGGQLGAMHDAASLAEGIAAMSSDRTAGTVYFDFMAGGSGARLMARFAGAPGVKLNGTRSSADWRREVVRYPIGLVALTPAGMNVCIPSKTYAIMAAGLAIIAICPATSDLAALVRQTGAGWVVDNSDGNPKEAGRKFAELVRDLVTCPEQVFAARQRARRAAETTYGYVETGRRWEEFISKFKA